MKEEKLKEYKKICTEIIKVTIKFQNETDEILCKICDDLKYNCTHLPTNESNDPLNKDIFERKDYAFNKYLLHSRECSLRFLNHILNKLCRFEIKSVVLIKQVDQLKIVFVKFKQQLREIVGNIDDADPFAKHFIKMVNLFSFFINGLNNSSTNFTNFEDLKLVNFKHVNEKSVEIKEKMSSLIEKFEFESIALNIDFEEMKKMFINHSFCLKAITNVEKYLQNYSAMMCLAKHKSD